MPPPQISTLPGARASKRRGARLDKELEQVYSGGMRLLSDSPQTGERFCFPQSVVLVDKRSLCKKHRSHPRTIGDPAPPPTCPRPNFSPSRGPASERKEGGLTRNLEGSGLSTSYIPVLLRSAKSRYRGGIQHDAHNGYFGSELGDEGSSYSTRKPPEFVVEIQKTARQIIRKMTEKDASLLHERLGDRSGVKIACLFDISRPIFIKHRNKLLKDTIRQIASDLNEEGQDAVIERIVICYYGKEGIR